MKKIFKAILFVKGVINFTLLIILSIIMFAFAPIAFARIIEKLADAVRVQEAVEKLKNIK